MKIHCACAMLLLAGSTDSCERGSTELKVRKSPTVAEVSPEWQIESHGQFRAGHGNNIREILTVTDPNGRKFIAITGCGVYEWTDRRYDPIVKRFVEEHREE